MKGKKCGWETLRIRNMKDQDSIKKIGTKKGAIASGKK